MDSLRLGSKHELINMGLGGRWRGEDPRRCDGDEKGDEDAEAAAGGPSEREHRDQL